MNKKAGMINVKTTAQVGDTSGKGCQHTVYFLFVYPSKKKTFRYTQRSGNVGCTCCAYHM